MHPSSPDLPFHHHHTSGFRALDHEVFTIKPSTQSRLHNDSVSWSPQIFGASNASKRFRPFAQTLCLTSRPAGLCYPGNALDWPRCSSGARRQSFISSSQRVVFVQVSEQALLRNLQEPLTHGNHLQCCMGSFYDPDPRCSSMQDELGTEIVRCSRATPSLRHQ
jgi:hypothetical protein